ncbi:MAG: amylo-alpha-1,6-glucosidase [Candidatus Saccharimonadales bacterium]
MNTAHLTQKAKEVLTKNDLGGWTRPTEGLYPHQWLWDSCFIAIGKRHIDVERAKEEVRALFKGQWRSGMLPHVIFSEANGYHAGPTLWQSRVSAHAPKNVDTTGISQPPMVAEAVVRIGEMLSPKERLAWYKEIHPELVHYHEWLYRERDPHDEGLVVLVHPWESGLDNTPPWMELLHKYAVSTRVWLMKNLKMERFVKRFRRDTALVPAEERISTIDLYAVYDLLKRLRDHHYNDSVIMRKQKLLIVDAVFNSILIRANDHLAHIADELGQQLPKVITQAMKKAPKALETLWDEETGQYYSRDFVSGELIKVSSIATFMPLYAMKLPKARVKKLLEHLHNPETFGADYPIPSTPLDSSYFKPHCYWQGPTWINMNWLIRDGLRRNGEAVEAEKLRQKTLELVEKGGMSEYFSPLTGKAAGAPAFSWTAALTIDLLADEAKPKK